MRIGIAEACKRNRALKTDCNLNALRSKSEAVANISQRLFNVIESQLTGVIMEQSDETTAGLGPEFPEIEDDVTQLNRILAELGGENEGGAFVSVFRLDKSGRNGEFLDRYDAAEFADGSLLDTVRSTWGAGRFQFSVYGPGGTGLRARKVVQIAPRRNEQIDTPSRSGGNGDAISELVRAMAEQHRATMSGLEMIAAALAKPAQVDSEKAMLERMRLFKELFHVEQPAGKEDTARALLEGVKLARELGGMDGGKEPQWMERVIDRLAGPAMEIMLANAARKPAALPSASAETVVPAATPQQPAASPETHQEDDSMLAFKLGLKTLMRSARDNDDVNETAERVLLLMGDETVETIIKRPNWFDVLCEHEPGAKVHKDWFDRLRTALEQQLETP